MGIFLEVNRISESTCNIKLQILLNSMLWNGENSSLDALCLNFWQSQYEEQFLSYSHKFSHLDELFTEVCAIIDAE